MLALAVLLVALDAPPVEPPPDTTLAALHGTWVATVQTDTTTHTIELTLSDRALVLTVLPAVTGDDMAYAYEEHSAYRAEPASPAGSVTLHRPDSLRLDLHPESGRLRVTWTRHGVSDGSVFERPAPDPRAGTWRLTVVDDAGVPLDLPLRIHPDGTVLGADGEPVLGVARLRGPALLVADAGEALVIDGVEVRPLGMRAVTAAGRRLRVGGAPAFWLERRTD